MDQGRNRGAQERYEAMVEEFLDPLYRTALRLTGHRSDAEDLVQETFLRAWRSFDRFQEGTNARAWLFKILMNAYIDRYRRSHREPERVDQEDIGEFYLSNRVHGSTEFSERGNPEAFIERIMDEHVRKALSQLPAPFRMAVVLADIEGFSYKEISEILDIPLGTVMSRLHRGRQQLRQALWEYAMENRRVSGE
ncbi:MAG: sigma-70 family RNA polymerase sigma factor [Armatimonadota bacterium]|nr:sigma-70 family RNA polymerase sigma factor [Armatimonadota bacterium]MDR5703331.1 sigma-70 family RNA polymerase sigma factor [Armatimonadota bacterium]MDR7433513.1 sigma-70 family RNA polymerase sigma factor [Armatimonadota bacterium]